MNITVSETRAQIIFWLIFASLVVAVILLDKFYGMLRDESTAVRKPYSFSRVQLAWWSVIILSAFSAVVISSHKIPRLDNSTLILLGISSVTTAAAAITNPPQSLRTNPNGENFFLDLLSDAKTVTVPRFQIVVFNLVFGIWMLYMVNYHLGHYNEVCNFITDVKDCSKHLHDLIIPSINGQALLLMGISSATYAGLRTTENH